MQMSLIYPHNSLQIDKWIVRLVQSGSVSGGRLLCSCTSCCSILAFDWGSRAVKLSIRSWGEKMVVKRFAGSLKTWRHQSPPVQTTPRPGASSPLSVCRAGSSEFGALGEHPLYFCLHLEAGIFKHSVVHQIEHSWSITYTVYRVHVNNHCQWKG